METMELCVTACEKFSNNNEVLASVQVAPHASGDPMCDRVSLVASSTVLLGQS